MKTNEYTYTISVYLDHYDVPGARYVAKKELARFIEEQLNGQARHVLTPFGPIHMGLGKARQLRVKKIVRT